MNDEIKELVSEVFGIDEDEVTLEVSQQSLANWDSMNHLKLVTAVEEEFEISLTMDDIENITDVKKLTEIIEKYKG